MAGTKDRSSGSCSASWAAAVPEYVGLEFVAGGLDFPAFVVEGGPFRGRGVLRRQEGGDQAVGGVRGLGQGVFHHAHARVRWAPVAAAYCQGSAPR